MNLHSFLFPCLFLLHSLFASTQPLDARSSPRATANPAKQKLRERAFGTWAAGGSTLRQAGVTGVGAMQVSVVADNQVLIFDRAENNPLSTNSHQAWGSIYLISTQAIRPLNLHTNSFCAGGSWTSNGSLISVGGNTVQYPYTSAAEGRQSIRIFNPCADGGSCDVYENASSLHLTSNRWYPSTVRLNDGSIMILGGDLNGGFNNYLSNDNPTFEFWPPKFGGQAIYSKFLHDALATNLFPVTFALPDGTIFVAANLLAMIYNWKTNTETRLPGIPNGVRINYPSSAAAVLLPLTFANSFTPEILMCGGSTADVGGDPKLLSSKYPASSQCIRMVLSANGIAGGWIVEQMPEARVMADGILTPDGKVVIVNGAGSGVAGYGNVPDQVGQSNAANPVYHADVYDPLGAPGQRFLTNFPSSSIERLYHSSATLLPDATIFLAGSNPNQDVTSVTYATRYQVEILSPPYVFSPNRPNLYYVPPNLLYGNQYIIQTYIPAATKVVTCVIMDLGFSTHGVHSSMRSVELAASHVAGATAVSVTAPSNPSLYSPGYAWLYVLADGVPSKGMRVMIGAGNAPPTSLTAQQANLSKKEKMARSHRSEQH